MTCNEICIRYKVTNHNPSTTRYAVGQKRCNACSIFIEYDGKNCPCCGTRLRTRPRGTKGREQLRIIQHVKRI